MNKNCLKGGVVSNTVCSGWYLQTFTSLDDLILLTVLVASRSPLKEKWRECARKVASS